MVDEKAKERKKRYFKKVYNNAPIIECACGCGIKMKSKDKYARDRKYVHGHGGRKYDNLTEYKRAWNHRNKKYRYEAKKKYVRKRKVDFISIKGNKCTECGIEYDGKNASIFDFHHRNPNSKKYALNLTSLQNISRKKALKELAKCDLLCSNCHRLLHTGGW